MATSSNKIDLFNSLIRKIGFFSRIQTFFLGNRVFQNYVNDKTTNPPQLAIQQASYTSKMEVHLAREFTRFLIR
jgi:hypothetical protein